MRRTPLPIFFAALLASLGCGNPDHQALHEARVEIARLGSELELAHQATADAAASCARQAAREDDERMAQEIVAWNERLAAEQAERGKEPPERALPSQAEAVLAAEQERLAAAQRERQARADQARIDATQRLLDQATADAAAPRRASSSRTSDRQPFLGTPRFQRQISGVSVAVNVHNPGSAPQRVAVKLSVYRNGRLDRSEVVAVDLPPRTVERLSHLVDTLLDASDQVNVSAELQ